MGDLNFIQNKAGLVWRWHFFTSVCRWKVRMEIDSVEIEFWGKKIQTNICLFSTKARWPLCDNCISHPLLNTMNSERAWIYYNSWWSRVSVDIFIVTPFFLCIYLCNNQSEKQGLFQADFDSKIPILGTCYLGAQISEKLSS